MTHFHPYSKPHCILALFLHICLVPIISGGRSVRAELKLFERATHPELHRWVYEKLHKQSTIILRIHASEKLKTRHS